MAISLSLSLSLSHRYPDLEIIMVQYLTSYYEVRDTRKRFFSQLFSFFFLSLIIYLPSTLSVMSSEGVARPAGRIKGPPRMSVGDTSSFPGGLDGDDLYCRIRVVLCTFYNTDSSCLPNKWEIPFELKTAQRCIRQKQSIEKFKLRFYVATITFNFSSKNHI